MRRHKAAKCIVSLLAGLMAVAVAVAAQALGAPEKLWETTGLKTPESALPDPTGTFAYVSNVNGSPTDKDGNGFISKISLKDGALIVPQWATGLDAPKGMTLANGRLFVSDIDKLVEIDPENGKIVTRYEAPGAKFLNDVAADAAGMVYVSDSSTSAIWRLAEGKFTKWMEGPELSYPNGVYVSGDKLILAAWGKPGTSAPSSEPARLLEVSVPEKSVRVLGDGAAVGNLDGIEPFDEQSFLVTDWVAGVLYRIDTSGKAEKLLALKQGTADIGWVPGQHLLLIPLMMEDKLAAYRIE